MVTTPRPMLTPLRAFLLLRYTLIAATSYLILVEDRFSVPATWSCVAIAFALLSNVFASMLPSRLLHSRWFTTGFFVADTTWVTSALIASGRFEADFFFVYFFVMLLAAMAESLALIAVASVAVCLAYLYVLSTSGSGWSVWNSPSVIRLPFLFTAAGFYGYMIDRTRSQERRAATAAAEARAHGESLAAVSRRIRAPITSMLSWASLLLDTSLDPEQQRCARRMQRCGEELLGIADGILDAATIAAGNVQIEAVAFEPIAVVEEVCAQHAAAADAEGLTLVERVDASVPLLLTGARSRVRHVLASLVENAIKVTESGDIEIRARLESAAVDDVRIRFEVVAGGASIAPELCASLAGGLGPDAASSTGAADGFGLAVAHQLVTAMRGELGVDNAPGGGSVFWFTIHCTEVGADAELAADARSVTIRTEPNVVASDGGEPIEQRAAS